VDLRHLFFTHFKYRDDPVYHFDVICASKPHMNYGFSPYFAAGYDRFGMNLLEFNEEDLTEYQVS
jgi:hypothetical protein